MAEFWWCVKHDRVEDPSNVCRSINRLGPYPTRAEAEQALETAERRNEAWDEDPVWNDDEED